MLKLTLTLLMILLLKVLHKQLVIYTPQSTTEGLQSCLEAISVTSVALLY